MRVAIVSTGHDVADARLHRTVAALRRAGCEVHVRALSRFLSLSPSRNEERDRSKDAQTDTADPAGKVRRGLRALLWPWQARCDVLITIDPDTALSAWLSSKVLRRRWVADVHEDYRELLRDRSWVPKPLLAVLRSAVSVLNWIITRADLVLVADEHVPPLEARSRFVMRNVPDVTLLPPMPPFDTPSFVPHEGTQGSASSPERAVSKDAGSVSSPEWPARNERAVSKDTWRAIYIGDNRTSRGLRDMVEAVAATADDPAPWKLDIVGPIAAADRGWFDERLTHPDARNISWHDRQPPAESWRIAAGADVGLCLLADTPAFRDAMPTKVYEYLAMGMPTIATPLPRVQELIDGTGAGTIVDGVPATVEALRRFASDDAHRTRLLANARAAGEEMRQRPSPYDDAAARIAGLSAPAPK